MCYGKKVHNYRNSHLHEDHKIHVHVHELTTRTVHCKLVQQQNNTTDYGVYSDVGQMSLVILKVGILEHKQAHTRYDLNL
jgi:hypothetical protein